MEPEVSELKVLVNLGLTLVQAKVYLALIASGPSKTSVISRISKVAQPDTYQNLSKLHKLGLVEKIIAKPFKYRAIPMKEGLSLLLKTRTAQYEKIKAETQVLIDTAKIERLKGTNQPEVPKFVLIPPGRTLIGRINTAIAQAQLSIDHVLSWKRFSHGIAHAFADSMEIAWAKNVKTRFIIENPLKSKTAKQLVQHCREKPFCQIKFITNCPNTVFAVFDKKEISIIVHSKTDLPGSPALWSNNRSLIALAEDYFETLWLTATESID